jgi:hypothetical protein
MRLPSIFLPRLTLSVSGAFYPFARSDHHNDGNAFVRCRDWVGRSVKRGAQCVIMLLQAFYSLRSERLLMERLEYDLLFRWFVGIDVDTQAGTIRCSRRTATGCRKAAS